MVLKKVPIFFPMNILNSVMAAYEMSLVSSNPKPKQFAMYRTKLEKMMNKRIRKASKSKIDFDMEVTISRICLDSEMFFQVSDRIRIKLIDAKMTNSSRALIRLIKIWFCSSMYTVRASFVVSSLSIYFHTTGTGNFIIGSDVELLCVIILYHHVYSSA